MPYGYDVANAKLPQAADPIGSALQGGIQGITLGLGLQRARQDAQTNQLQQQAAMQEIENKKFENFKNLLGVTQFPSFNSFSKKDKDLVGKKLAEATANYLGVPLDSNGFEWKDIHGELINAVSKISDDKNISDQERKRLIANKLDEHIGKVSNDVLDQIRKNQEFGFKQPPSTGSLIYLGQQDGSATLMNNKTGEMKRSELPGNGPLMPKNVTNEMANSSLYATRANDANKQLNSLIAGGFDPTSLSAGVQKLLPNYFQGEKAQSLEQIGRNLGAAILRKESGAAITKDEWEQVKLQYLPQPGDKPETLKQKAINRERAIQGLGYMGGQLPDLQNTVRSFKSVAEAEAANLPPGTIIEINGRRARIE